ncbi:transposase [Escherichia coli]|nr:transposase [Escherichia coli]
MAWRSGAAVPPAYTSQRCGHCGHTAKKRTACHKVNSDAVCGYTANADVNTLNI